jgi:hypothetical protein
MADTHPIRFHPSHDKARNIADSTDQSGPGAQSSKQLFFKDPVGKIKKCRSSEDERGDR